MRFRLAPRSVILDDIKLSNFQRISRNFADLGDSNG